MEVLFGAADTRSQHSRETKVNIEQKRPIVDLAVKKECGLPVRAPYLLDLCTYVRPVRRTCFCRKFCVNVHVANLYVNVYSHCQ